MGCVKKDRSGRKGAREREKEEKLETTQTKKTPLTLGHRRLVPCALLVHRDDRRMVFKPCLAHLAAVHFGFPAL